MFFEISLLSNPELAGLLPPRPLYPGVMPYLDCSSIQWQPGEDPQALARQLKNVRFLSQMFKLMSGPRQLGYKSGIDAYRSAKSEYGNQNIDAANGIGEVFSSVRGWAEDSVDVAHEVGGFAGHEYGFGWAEGSDNVDFSPSVNDLMDEQLSAEEYKGIFKDPKNNPGDYASYADDWSDLKEYLKGYGDKSYYDIIMSGTKTSTYEKKDADPKGDTSNYFKIKDRGSFAYDSMADYGGVQHKGAYYLMLGLLDMRRKVNFGMTNILGPVYYLHSLNQGAAPNDKALIAWSKAFENGLDPANLRINMLFFSAQHYWRQILQGASPGINSNWENSMGEVGYYSGKNRVANKELNDFLSNHIPKYIADLRKADPKSKEADRVEKLWKEFNFDKTVEQPYNWVVGDWNNPGDGWDLYSPHWQDQNTLKWTKPVPENVNPLWDDLKINHPYYASAQTLGLSDGELNGMQDVEGKHLTEANWVANFVSRGLNNFKYVENGRNNVLAANLGNTQQYNVQKRDYDRKVAEEKERILSEKIAESRALAESQARRHQERIEAEKKAQALQASERAQEQKRAQNSALQKQKKS